MLLKELDDPKLFWVDFEEAAVSPPDLEGVFRFSTNNAIFTLR